MRTDIDPRSLRYLRPNISMDSGLGSVQPMSVQPDLLTTVVEETEVFF